MDRHEWYAPPQIYTRDDSTGLWKAKSAFQQLPTLLPSQLSNDQQQATNKSVPASGEANLKEFHQDGNQELLDGVASMETSDDSSRGFHSENLLDVGKKKRRVAEDSTADTGDRELKDIRNVENGAAMSGNASYAEHVIEPTLVMFEVSYFLIRTLTIK